ncbi:hypothetical protein JVU11DRAFT_2468 [Chiua virens]|nr:hypothetical protein JVU11DRAFT_2468 [Chiua virens]
MSPSFASAMSFIKDQMFTTTRMKSIIPNRLPFRHSSKGTDVSESVISEHIKPEHGHGVTTPSNTVNVVLFGETGVGKSSVINLIAQRTIAKVSSDVNGCTMESTKHDIEFDGMKFAIFDTIGLEEPQMGVNGYLKAIEKAYELITQLNHVGGVHLLLFCMRGGRITATTQSNYRLFCEILCSTKVPIALVFTGLEWEVEMEDWWRRNQKHIEGYGIKSDGHACVTAVLDNDTPGEDLKYNESRVVIRDLLRTCALKNTAYSPDTFSWFARFGRDLMSLIEKRMSPKRKKVLKVLVKRCKLDPDTAKKIADMMENGDPNVQPAQSATLGEVNPPDPGAPADPGSEEGGGDADAVPSNPDSGDEISDGEGEDRPSENGVVIPPPLDASSSRKTTEARQQAQGGNKEEESRFNAELNAFGRQKTKHANEYVATSNPNDADRAGTVKLSDNPPNSDRRTPWTGSSLPPPEGVPSDWAVILSRAAQPRLSLPGAKEPHADSAPNSTPYTGNGETAIRPKRVPSPASADKRSAGGSPGQTKKVSNPDSGASNWSATSLREGSVQFKRGSNLEVASQSRSRVGTGGSTRQPKHAGSVVQPPKAVVLPQTRTG